MWSYDRDTLLTIGDSMNTDQKHVFRDEANELTETATTTTTNEPWRQRRRGCRAGARKRLRLRPTRLTLPSILLANVQSLENNMDELSVRMAKRKELRDCNIICLTETCLGEATPDHAIALAGYSIFRQDRTNELTGKGEGGGVCFLVNNSWCTPGNMYPLDSSCSPDLEYISIICLPIWSPREIPAVIVYAVSIPTSANVDAALRDLRETIANTEARYPDAALIVAGDFNHASLKKCPPNDHQHVGKQTRGSAILDHAYSCFRNGYKAFLHPPIGESEHSAVFLLPTYKTKTVEALRWDDQSEATLSDCFACTNGSIFEEPDNIDGYTEGVCGTDGNDDSLTGAGSFGSVPFERAVFFKVAGILGVSAI